MNRLVLAGDIGATKTNLGLFKKAASGLERVVFCNFPSCDKPGFVRQAQDFLRRESARHDLAAICFGVAGPVHEGSVEATNLGLKVDEKGLQKEFACRFLTLVNDLYATAVSIPFLKDRELAVLQPGDITVSQSTAIAVLAPGTGLGMAFLVGDEKSHILASEGGHADFAPRNEVEVDLWRYLKLRFGRVSRERLLSGPGLLNIYEWLRQKDLNQDPPDLGNFCPRLADKAAALVAAADRGEDPLAEKTLAIFVALLGSVAGDLVLTGMAGGGLYLAGGIPGKIIAHLRKADFLAAFRDKGRMAPWLEKVPVKVVLDPEAALYGAARIAFDSVV